MHAHTDICVLLVLITVYAGGPRRLLRLDLRHKCVWHCYSWFNVFADVFIC